MKVGIVASKTGSVFREVHTITEKLYPGRFSFYVVTDRQAEIEQFCLEKHIPHFRALDKTEDGFSSKVVTFFEEFGGVDVSFLFFQGLVGPVLFRRYPTLNIHPSLLPAFQGTKPISAALEANSKFLGCTLHVVDGVPEHGQILAQASLPIPQGTTEFQLTRWSFLQRVYLMLLALEHLDNKVFVFSNPSNQEHCEIRGLLSHSDRFNPCLENTQLLEELRHLQEKEGIRPII